MKQIHYAGDVLLTGDSIADAVLRYAGALAVRESSANITIPVRLTDGRVASANLLIGPASQLVTVPHGSGFDEIVDEELVTRLTLDANRLSNAHPQVQTDANAHADSGAPSEWDL